MNLFALQNYAIHGKRSQRKTLMGRLDNTFIGTGNAHCSNVLNSIPRKRFGYTTPKEKYKSLTNKEFDAVASSY